MTKSFYLLSLAFLCLTASCQKSKVDPDVSLTGKWKVVSYFQATWGGGEWHDLTANQKIYLEFKTDGTLNGDDLATDYASYVVKDSVTLILTPKNGNDTKNYGYEIDGNFLTISPAGPMRCISGCGTKYVKQ